MSDTVNTPKEEKAGIGGYIALIFACVFFSGLCAGNHWWGIFDFATLNGSFGKLVSGVTLDGDAVKAATTTFRGKGGSGALDGFAFALTLVPTVMFALAMITVCDHYGALRAARQLLTPILRPMMGVPGSCSTLVKSPKTKATFSLCSNCLLTQQLRTSWVLVLCS